MKYSDLLLENKAQYKQMMQVLVDSELADEASAQQVITSARQVLKRNDRITWYLKWYRVTSMYIELDELSVVDDAESISQKEAIAKMYSKAAKGLQLPSITAIDSHCEDFERLFWDLTKPSTMHMMSMMEQIPALGDVKWDGSPSDLNDKLQSIETEWKKSSDQEIQVDQYETDAWEVLIDHNGKQGWVLLNMEYCKLEGGAMGHCGNGANPKADDRILSFRTITSEKHKPHLTFVLGKDGKLGEMKGRENDKPAAKYHGAIVALLKHDIVKGFGDGGGEPEKNFSMDDLPDDMSAELLKEKPALDPSLPVHNIEYYEDGSIEYESHSVRDVPHREDGPAEIKYYRDGSIKFETYYINGETHREDGPAEISYYEDGSIEREEYQINGEQHREDGPAVTQYFPDGHIRREEYQINGEHHREEGPANISYYEDGAISSEAYSINGKQHREDGPAEISYYPNGSIEREAYHIDGKWHREDGPAIIGYYEDGSIQIEVESNYDSKKYEQGEKYPDKKQNESINRLQQLAGIK
jgi:antitoxin component YwqK of YwqJK toxin-antitoxin module